MDATRKCPNCSAILKRLDERFCGFCGTEVPVPTTSTTPPSPYGDLPARFAALSVHPRLAAVSEREPDDAWISRALTFRAVFGLVFAAIGAAVGLVFLITIIGAPFALLPFGFTALGIWIFVDATRRQTRYSSAPLRRVPALVVGERTKVSGGGRNTSAHTTYFVTLELEDGERSEVRTRGSVLGEVTEGDMGLAFVRQAFLLDFARIPV